MQPDELEVPAHLLKANVLSKDCPSREIMRHITSQWGVLVLIVLLRGTHRFSELRRAIGGVSERMLAQTLKNLEGHGLISRKSLPVVPPHTEYSLTPLGQDAAKRIRNLTVWIEANIGEFMDLPADLPARS